MFLLLPLPAFDSVVQCLDSDSKLALWQTCNKELTRLLMSCCQLTIILNNKSDQQLKALQGLIDPTKARVALKLACSSDQKPIPISFFEPVLGLPVWRTPGLEFSCVNVLCLQGLTLDSKPIGDWIRRHVPNVTRLQIDSCSVHQHTGQYRAQRSRLCQLKTSSTTKATSEEAGCQQTDVVTLPEVLSLQVLTRLEHLHISFTDSGPWTNCALQKQLAQLPHLAHLSLGPLPCQMPAYILSDLPQHIISLAVDFVGATGFNEQHYHHLRTNTHLHSLELLSLHPQDNKQGHAPVSLADHMPLLEHLHMSAVLTDQQFQRLLQHDRLTSLCITDTQFVQSYACIPCKLEKLDVIARFLECFEIARLPLANLKSLPTLPSDIRLSRDCSTDDDEQLVEWAAQAAANLSRCGGFVISPGDGLNIMQTCDMFGDQSCCIHSHSLAAQCISHILPQLKSEISFLQLTRLPIGQETVQALNLAHLHRPRTLHFVECDLKDGFWAALRTLLHSGRLSDLEQVWIEDCNPVQLDGLSHLCDNLSVDNCSTSHAPELPTLSGFELIATTSSTSKYAAKSEFNSIVTHPGGVELSTDSISCAKQQVASKRIRLLVSWCPDRVTYFTAIFDTVTKVTGFIRFSSSEGAWVDNLWTAEIDLVITGSSASMLPSKETYPLPYSSNTGNSSKRHGCMSCHAQQP